MKYFANSIAFALLFTVIACGNNENSKTIAYPCGQIDCPPVTAASPHAKQVLKDLEGRWKWVSLNTRYTATNQEATYKSTDPKAPDKKFCFALNGGIQFSAYDQLTCKYCYQLADEGENVRINVSVKEGNAQSCGLQLLSGLITIHGDSLIIKTEERLQSQVNVYRRLTAEGKMKMN